MDQGPGGPEEATMFFPGAVSADSHIIEPPGCYVDPQERQDILRDNVTRGFGLSL